MTKLLAQYQDYETAQRIRDLHEEAQHDYAPTVAVVQLVCTPVGDPHLYNVWCLHCVDPLDAQHLRDAVAATPLQPQAEEPR